MEPITAITSAISGIKTATEIAQVLKAADRDYAAAEYKLQLADMMSSLADTKIAIAELKEVLANKDEEIKTLQDEISKLEDDTEKLERKANGLYYAEGDDDPFCPHCYEVESKKYHLIPSPRIETRFGPLKCTQCTNFYYHKRGMVTPKVTPEKS